MGWVIIEALLTAMLGLSVSGLIALLIPILMGHLVPASRIDLVQREAEKWHDAFDSLKEAHEIQTKTLERIQITAEVTDRVMRGIHSAQSSMPKVIE